MRKDVTDIPAGYCRYHVEIQRIDTCTLDVIAPEGSDRGMLYHELSRLAVNCVEDYDWDSSNSPEVETIYEFHPREDSTFKAEHYIHVIANADNRLELIDEDSAWEYFNTLKEERQAAAECAVPPEQLPLFDDRE